MKPMVIKAGVAAILFWRVGGQLGFGGPHHREAERGRTSGGNAEWVPFPRGSGVGQTSNETVYPFAFDPATPVPGTHPKQLRQPHGNVLTETCSVGQGVAFFVTTDFRKRAWCVRTGVCWAHKKQGRSVRPRAGGGSPGADAGTCHGIRRQEPSAKKPISCAEFVEVKARIYSHFCKKKRR